MAGKGFVSAQDPSSAPGRTNAADGVLDGVLHIGMRGLAQVPERRRKIGWPDEHAVHAFDGRDRIQVIEAQARFHLDQQAHLIVGLMQIVRHAIPLRRPRQSRSNAANPGRWITHRGDQLLRLLRAFNHGNQQRLRTDIEQLLDELDVARNRPHDGMHGIRRHGLQLREDGSDIVGRVLAVNQQPIEAGAGGDFRTKRDLSGPATSQSARAPRFSARL